MSKCLFVLALFFVIASPIEAIADSAASDSDHDGISDGLEAALLVQFAPTFLVSADDCSARPAEFVSLESKPVVLSDNGTIYGQAFPRKGKPDQVELHFYHLWRTDCGDMGHILDAEHVSALVSRDQDASWRALYWYAAAHEDTICDDSQIARATTIEAELHGPRIWISRGKHASFLSDVLCTRGCGSDECRDLRPLAVPAIINLGEPTAFVGGAAWAAAPQWPLAGKMRRSDFEDARLVRVNQLSANTILWANPQKRPYQAAIHGGNDAVDGVATGARATDAALDLADGKTGNALGRASNDTGNGLARSYTGVRRALRITAEKVGNALGLR
jgi:hypothetical protein